jgi:arylsulfatase A-like enzyme
MQLSIFVVSLSGGPYSMQYLRTLSLLTYCLLATYLLAGTNAAAAENAQPNLLVIHTDEHNFRTLGCYRETLPKDQALMWGPAVVETPHIDWIAEHGALCTSFYATTPVCSPSRAAFVSGRYPQNTPVVTNNIPMNDDIVTFAEILGNQGYTTGYAGKWHLDGTGKPQWSPERKFGFAENTYMFNRGHWKQLEDTAEGPRVKARRNGKPTYDVKGADEQSFATDFLARKTIEFISANKDQPFCFMVSLPDPHGPDTVRPPYDTMFADQTYQAPKSALKPTAGLPGWAAPQRGGFDQSKYYGMVKCIDDNVGKILAALRENGLLEKTIVVFTADHGDLRGEHQRHNKGVPFEGSAKIPFVIYFQGKIEAGLVIDQALGCVDFLPTVLALMNVKTAGKEEGRDASELFLTGRVPDDWTDIAFLRSTGQEEGWLAAVTDRYKLIYSTKDEPWLFDLAQDPDELVNAFLDADKRQIVRELSLQLADYGRQSNDPRAANPYIQADLRWAIEGDGPYTSTRPAKQPREKAAGKKATSKRRKKSQ